MATYELLLPSYRELSASLVPAHLAELPIRRARAVKQRTPSIAHLRPSARAAHRALSAGACALTAAVLTGLAGSMVMGVALAYGLVALPWSRAFAIGMVGGAAIGLVIGVVAALLVGAGASTSAARAAHRGR